MIIQLAIVSGKKAGTSWATRRFPVRIGRAADSDLRFEDPGVWDQHGLIDFDPAIGFVLRAQPDAPVRVNGETVDAGMLRNGDLIEVGEAKVQFWLAETRQSGLWLKDAFTWVTIVSASLAQIGLLYWLLR